MKKKMDRLRQGATILAMLAIALAAGVHAVQAAQDSWFQATGTLTGTSTNAEFTRTTLDFTDENSLIDLRDGNNDIHLGSGTDLLHFHEGNDKVNLGSGNDFLSMGNGDDAMPFWGGAGIISFDAATYGDWFDRTTDYKDYIYCNTPEDGATPFDSEMEIRSDEVTIRSNNGDVIIQLGG